VSKTHFLVNFWPIVQQIVAKSVQLGEIDAQVRDSQQFRDLVGVRIF
jgi:hypothetical protein